MAIILFFIAHWYLSLFSQTFFQHRYASHGAFKMSRGWEKVFFVITWFTQGSSYLSTRTYAIMHRLHHAHTDTEQDPHSPSYSKNVFDMMWKTWLYYDSINSRTREIDPQFLKNVPDWPVFEKFANSMPSRLLWVAVYIGIYAAFATSPWLWLLLPVQIVMGPVHGAVINWYAHKYGYQNYKMKNTSENLLHVDILMLGESYHNNHHKFPASANFGVKWHEVDPIYPIVLLCDKLGIIQITRTNPVISRSEVRKKEKMMAEVED